MATMTRLCRLLTPPSWRSSFSARARSRSIPACRTAWRQRTRRSSTPISSPSSGAEAMTFTSRIDLSEHVRKHACALLQARLSDALDLEAQAKQAHWNVKGPHFLQLHQLFDAVHDTVEQFVDLLAERITTLGHIADGRVATTASATTLYG